MVTRESIDYHNLRLGTRGICNNSVLRRRIPNKYWRLLWFSTVRSLWVHQNEIIFKRGNLDFDNVMELSFFFFGKHMLWNQVDLEPGIGVLVIFRDNLFLLYIGA